MKTRLIVNISLFMVIAMMCFLSCSKKDIRSERTENNLKLQFFDLPSDASTELQTISNIIRKQDSSFDFITKLIKESGLPVWENVVTNAKNTYKNQKQGSLNDSLIFFIPFKAVSSSEITSYLVCMKVDTRYNFRFYRKNVLDTMSTVNKQRKNFLESALSVFAFFEKKINNKDSSLIRGVYNKYFADVSINFSENNQKQRSFRTDFSAYGVETCYRVQCDVQNSARVSTLFECYTCSTSWDINWSGIGGTSISWWFNDGGGTYGTVENSNYPPVLISLINLLSLNSSEADFLANQIDRANEVLYYLQNTSATNSNQIAIGHIDRMINDMQYLSYVQLHAQSNPGGVMWWEDDSFISTFGGQDYGNWAINYLISTPDLPFSIFQNQSMIAPEGQDDVYDPNYWDDATNVFNHQNLPSWQDFKNNFPSHSDPLYNTPSKLYASIGGAVLTKVGTNSTANTCAARVSKALNYSGVTIPYIPKETFKGNDGKYYFLGAANLNRWMRKTFGCANPDASIGEYYNSNALHFDVSQAGQHTEKLGNLLKGKQGIYSLVTDPAWATGHADIISSNTTCDGSCYFGIAPLIYADFWGLQ